MGDQFSNWMHQVNSLENRADHMSTQLAVGDARNLHSVMIAQEEASLALSSVLQVRSHALDAYQEIMRMQV